MASKRKAKAEPASTPVHVSDRGLRQAAFQYADRQGLEVGQELELRALLTEVRDQTIVQVGTHEVLMNELKKQAEQIERLADLMDNLAQHLGAKDR